MRGKGRGVVRGAGHDAYETVGDGVKPWFQREITGKRGVVETYFQVYPPAFGVYPPAFEGYPPAFEVYPPAFEVYPPAFEV
jgi:hypothetical protein